MGWLSSIFRIVIPIVAAVIGFVISGFNPMGAVYGFGLGMAIGGALFPPEAENKQSGGPGQLQLSTANYGGAIPVVYGARRVAGNLIWAGPLETVAVEHDAGGGGCMGGDATYVTYEYYISFAMAICVGPGRKEVLRIFKNKDEYVYDRRTGMAYSITNMLPLDQYGCVMAGVVIDAFVQTGQLGTGSFSMTMYDGTQTSPDPTMAAAVANPCPYRNLCYVVFPRFYLGNTPMMPQLSFEVVDVIVNEDIVPKVTSYYMPGVEREGALQYIYAEGYLWIFVADVYNLTPGVFRLDKFDLNTMTVVASSTLSFGINEVMLTKDYNSFMYYSGGYLYVKTAYRLTKISCGSMTIHKQWWVGPIINGYPPDDPTHVYVYGMKGIPWFGGSQPWFENARPESGADWEDYFTKLGRRYGDLDWSWYWTEWDDRSSDTIAASGYHVMLPGEGTPEYFYLYGEESISPYLQFGGKYSLRTARQEEHWHYDSPSRMLVGDTPLGRPISVGDGNSIVFTYSSIQLYDTNHNQLAFFSADSLPNSNEFIRGVTYCDDNASIYITTSESRIYRLSVPGLEITAGISPAVGCGSGTATIIVQRDSWSTQIFVRSPGEVQVFDLDLNRLHQWWVADLEGVDTEGDYGERVYDYVPFPVDYGIQGTLRGQAIYTVGVCTRMEYPYTQKLCIMKMVYPPDFLYVYDLTPQEVTEDILTNKFYGNGLESEFVDYETNNQGKLYALEADMLISPAFDRQRSILDALQYVLQHHDGFITYYDGKIAHRQFEIRSADINYVVDANKSDDFSDSLASPNWRAVIE